MLYITATKKIKITEIYCSKFGTIYIKKQQQELAATLTTSTATKFHWKGQTSIKLKNKKPTLRLRLKITQTLSQNQPKKISSSQSILLPKTIPMTPVSSNAKTNFKPTSLLALQLKTQLVILNSMIISTQILLTLEQIS